MTAETSRVPAGVSSGGQFTATVHGEAPVRLFNRSDGSFLKPSPSSTAEHCIQFWSNVTIPDEVIEQAEQTYDHVRGEEIATEMDAETDAWSERYVANNPRPRREGRDLDRWEAQYAVDRDAFRDSIEEVITSRRPRYLGSYDARQIVRAAQMYHHRPHSLRFPEESRKVLDYQVELFDGVMSVDEIERVYEMDKIHFCLEEIIKDDSLERQIVEKLAELSGGIAGVHEELSYQSNVAAQNQY
jgi:hypothetical protein